MLIGLVEEGTTGHSNAKSVSLFFSFCFALSHLFFFSRTFLHLPLLPFVADLHRTDGHDDGGDEEENTAHDAGGDGTRPLQVDVVVWLEEG